VRKDRADPARTRGRRHKRRTAFLDALASSKPYVYEPGLEGMSSPVYWWTRLERLWEARDLARMERESRARWKALKDV
jgi:hypothetical protein